MKFSVLLLVSAAVLTLNSCNTFAGIGRDVKSLGNGVENKAYGKTWKGDASSKNSQPQQQQTQVPQTTVKP
ncbi:MAG: putative small secreted protein [Crocinitomicaceae bacterium]|jgi:predicted small secreted protein